MLCQCSRGRCRCVRVSDARVERLYEAYREDVGLSTNAWQFPGVTLNDLVTVERVFDVAINVFSLKAKGKADLVWTSKKRSGGRLNLNLHKTHFSYIKDINAYASSFACGVCGGCYTRSNKLSAHACVVRDVSRMKFVGGDFVR